MQTSKANSVRTPLRRKTSIFVSSKGDRNVILVKAICCLSVNFLIFIKHIAYTKISLRSPFDQKWCGSVTYRPRRAVQEESPLIVQQAQTGTRWTLQVRGPKLLDTQDTFDPSSNQPKETHGWPLPWARPHSFQRTSPRSPVGNRQQNCF